MGLFSRWKDDPGQDLRRTDSIKPLSPERGVIRYDAGLVNQLKDEHQDLLQTYFAIQRSGEDGHVSHLPDLLEKFKMAFLNHVALENVKFYVYMQNHWVADSDTMGFIANVRKEMNTISRAVVKFVDSHLAESPSPPSLARFNSELQQIGEVLSKRISMEEQELYSLYRP